MTVRVITGDCRDVLRTLPDESVHCVVTSPPYWGLRDYGLPPSVWGGDPACRHEWGEGLRVHKGGPHGDGVMLGGSRSVVAAQALTKDIDAGAFCVHCGAWRGALGLEPTHQLHVAHIVEIFREVRRVLRKDGTLWVNYGDSYATAPNGRSAADTKAAGNDDRTFRDKPFSTVSRVGRSGNLSNAAGDWGGRPTASGNLKPKDLCGIPWRVAFGLQDDGWWLRQDIIWAKPNPMPESIRDRCTKAHEYLFLLAKSERYYFDQDGITEPCESGESDLRKMDEQLPRIGGKHKDLIDPLSKASALTNIGQKRSVGGRRSGNKERKAASERGVPVDDGGRTVGAVAGSVPWEGFVRNKRSVWTVGTQPFSDAHFATFPPALIEPCILAGCPKGGTVLDPFGGAGTTGLVADRLQRDAILIELNPAYAEMARRRIIGDAPLLVEAAE